MIFVRDIYKQWYVTGINDQQNTVDKTYELLSRLVRGYEVVTAGSSAGGYAAVLFGLKLGAKKIYSFSGQFSLECEIDGYFWLKKYKTNTNYSKYYELIDLINTTNTNNIPIYYFYPAKSIQDIEQFNVIKNIRNIHVFAFESDKHGITMLGSNFQFILIKSNKRLQKLCRIYEGKSINQKLFLRKSAGIIRYMLIKYLMNKKSNKRMYDI